MQGFGNKYNGLWGSVQIELGSQCMAGFCTVIVDSWLSGS